MSSKKEKEKGKQIENEKGVDPGTDILSLIEVDHQEVKELFKQLETSKDAKKIQKVFEQIYQEMALHAHAEETAFYPAMREFKETAKFLEDAEEEHNSVKILLEQMKSLKPKEAEFETKFTHLKESMLHHIEEEENEIFSAVRDCMEEEQLQKLGEEFQEAKESWIANVEAALKRR